MEFLYTEQKLNCDGFITASEESPHPHKLYWQEYGNPKGQPVMLMHGGPGSGAMVTQARLFDPNHYRIVMFDQRGSGKSTPHASLNANTTQDLVNDINILRDSLKINDKMHIFGGSWGSTLALVYAIQHPDLIKSITIYGVFLGRENDIKDFYQSNATNLNDTGKAGFIQRKLENEWKRYVEFIQENERNDMIQAYSRKLVSNDPNTRLLAAQYWNRWERASSKYIYDEASVSIEPENDYSIAHARIENHYFNNGLFLSEDGGREQNYILDNAEKISGIPMAIIQGKHDYVCPTEQAIELHSYLDGISKTSINELYIVENAGHTMRDPGMQEAIVSATDKFRKL